MYVTAAICLVVQLMTPPLTPESPQRLNIRYVDDNGEARWDVDAVPPLLRSRVAFAPASRAIAPWVRTPPQWFTAPAPRLPLEPPGVRIVSDDRSAGRRLVLELRSARAAESVGLIFRAPSLTSLRIDGIAPLQRPPKFASQLTPGWHAVNVIGARQAMIEIVLKTNEPVEAIALDRSGTLPPEAGPLLHARNASLGVPSGSGDAVVVQRRLRL